MAIFTDNKLTAERIEVRFYNYSDPNMGWGDTGTHMYAEFPLSAFEVEEDERFDKSKYYVYSFTEEWYEKLKGTLGNCWWMGHGYEMATEEKKEKERLEKAALIAALSANEIVHKF